MPPNIWTCNNVLTWASYGISWAQFFVMWNRTLMENHLCNKQKKNQYKDTTIASSWSQTTDPCVHGQMPWLNEAQWLDSWQESEYIFLFPVFSFIIAMFLLLKCQSDCSYKAINTISVTTRRRLIAPDCFCCPFPVPSLPCLLIDTWIMCIVLKKKAECWVCNQHLVNLGDHCVTTATASQGDGPNQQFHQNGTCLCSGDAARGEVQRVFYVFMIRVGSSK